ncbi:transposase [Streptomyces koyangensis]
MFGSLPRQDQRRRGACCLHGLMLDERRRSIQPMAERLREQAGSAAVREPIAVGSVAGSTANARRLSEVITPQVWVIDDVSFPSVAQGLCRGGPSVLRSTRIAAELPGRGRRPCRHRYRVVSVGEAVHLPQEWTDEPGRCRRASVHDDVVHQEKWRLTLGALDYVSEWGPKAPAVLADAGYGVATP